MKHPISETCYIESNLASKQVALNLKHPRIQLLPSCHNKGQVEMCLLLPSLCYLTTILIMVSGTNTRDVSVALFFLFEQQTLRMRTHLVCSVGLVRTRLISQLVSPNCDCLKHFYFQKGYKLHPYAQQLHSSA